ncbi:MAG: Fe-S cluster assembly protein SufD [Gammaproteobacteria bacterium]|nr:Fe-S cluster assembly protein SufD [Gammaproteobacteria bacterium]
MNAVVRIQDEARERYRELLATTAQTLPGQELEWLTAQRAEATAAFLRQGFPTRKDEAWRYTSLDKLLQQTRVTHATPLPALSVADVEPFRLTDDAVARLVFVNGVFSPSLSQTHDIEPDVEIAGLHAALEQTPDKLAEWLGRAAGTAPTSFAALNTALHNDGVWIYIPAGVRLAGPIEVLYLSSGTEVAQALSPRNLIVLENGAQATVVEYYASHGAATCFTNSLTEVQLGEAAGMEHYRLQDEDAQASHLSSLYIRQGRSSHYRGLSVSLGASWSRTEYHNCFEQPNARCDLDGLYVAGDRQLTDFHLDIRHAVPGCTSRERFKGILLGRGRAVFDGRIRVEQDAQQTDAVLTNHNLLLSRDAEVDTKPQLEIFADDVKCSHGTTIGQLEPAQMFYLRSRGIREEDARRMLCLGFATELLADCGVPGFRTQVERRLESQLSADAVREPE